MKSQTMADFLLELFSEEIPARMQADAITYMRTTLEKHLGVNAADALSTPRRLAVIFKDLPATQPDISTELKGPKLDAPEAALQGFLKKNSLTLEQLEKRDGVYFATLHTKGRPTAELLKDAVEAMLAAFPWPKSMRWGSGSQSWVRPLHSILCLFDGNIIPVEFAGIKAGNTTYGHRFMAPAPITISAASEYESALKRAHVHANREARKSYILEQAQAAAKSVGTTLKNDPALLEEVTGLVEYPVVLIGKIDDAFMDLPPEVLTTVMRSHQKYFALQRPDGSLSAHFLITANIKTEDGGKAIISGNERVLRARFADARFFWDTDRTKPLTDWAKGLATVTYHAKLGTIADKVSRITALADQLADLTKADKKLVHQAATLCKADLVTGMVGEFAELQGLMGRYYALQQHEAPEVADAIRDHYKPQGPSDAVPSSPVSATVALADKLDTLVSMFAIGEKPTGSKDPFALRRAALGVIRIVLENGMRLPLKSFINDELYAFFIDRLKVQLKEDGMRHDVINAVIADDDDIYRIYSRAKALQDLLSSDDGKNILAGYKRAANILAIEEKKDKAIYSAEKLNISTLTDDEEKTLATLLTTRKSELAEIIAKDQFVGAANLLSKFRQPIDLFFDKIMVNCEEKELRKNRLCLLANIRDCMNVVADFSKIEG
jgi:glycyl-tRNA synthetase beta chain